VSFEDRKAADRFPSPFSGGRQRGIRVYSKLSFVVQRRPISRMRTTKACQYLLHVGSASSVSWLEKRYLIGLQGARKGPATSELEHLDGRKVSNTQSRQLG
jgi:hypothetical protein